MVPYKNTNGSSLHSNTHETRINGVRGAASVSSTSSSAKRTVMSVALAAASALGFTGVSAQEVAPRDQQIRPGQIPFTPTELSGGKIVVRNGEYATMPKVVNPGSASETKIKDVSFSAEEISRVVAVRQNARIAFSEFARVESEENLRKLYDAYMEWQRVDLKNGGYNQDGLAERIRNALVWKGYTKVPPV